jgi:hypothetical protein
MVYTEKSPRLDQKLAWSGINFDENKQQIIQKAEGSNEYFTTRNKSINKEFEINSGINRQIITNQYVSNRLKNINKNRYV